MQRILSIQSSVAYGHVGNSAATFPLMRVGIEVLPVITVHFSNHTGYGSWRGPLLAPSDVADVIKGIDERGALAHCDAVLSGYTGDVGICGVVHDAVDLVRQRHPGALYCCDPVIGDEHEGVYVGPGIPELIRDTLVPLADIATPNQFELAQLTGAPTSGADDVLGAADALRSHGPGTVLVTSVTAGTPPDRLAMVIVTENGAWRVETPRVMRTFTGTGDLTSAMLLARLLHGDGPDAALGHTAAVLYAVCRITAESGESELQLVAAQDQLLSPRDTFPVVRIR